MTFGSFAQGGLAEFDAAADAIEQKLGELMGLDNAQDFAVRDPNVGMIGLDVTWEVPSQDHPFTIIVGYNDQEGRDADEIRNYVVGNFQTGWDLGANWATGIASTIKRYGRTYGDVDVSELKNIADALESHVALRLDGALTSNFSQNANRGTDLEKTLGNFQGEFAGKVHGFYTNVGDYVNSWATFAENAAAGYAGMAAVIDACQHDLAEWATKVRQHCDDQLANWASTGGFGILAMQNGDGVSAVHTLVELTDIVGFGASVVALFPPVAPEAGTVGAVSGIVNTIASHFDDGGGERKVTITKQRALDIWGWENSGSGASYELGSGIVDGCSTALRDLRAKQKDGQPSGTEDVAADAERRRGHHQWFAPRPSGVADPKPGDLFYDV